MADGLTFPFIYEDSYYIRPRNEPPLFTTLENHAERKGGILARATGKESQSGSLLHYLFLI